MYKSDNLKQTDNETFTYIIDKHKDFKILQLTDLHLGFGFISRKKDKLALNAVTKIIPVSYTHLTLPTNSLV